MIVSTKAGAGCVHLYAWKILNSSVDSLSKNICKIRAKIPSHWNQLSGADFMQKSSMEECDWFNAYLILQLFIVFQINLDEQIIFLSIDDSDLPVGVDLSFFQTE